MNETIKLPILYTYIEEIGKGAFGKVLKVEDLWGDEVAIKILNEDSINDISIKRFDREMKIHKMLEHKNIVPILDFNSEEEVPYYVMPLAKRNLSEELAAYREDNLGYMKEDDIAYYFAQILDAIEYAHSEGVIHRDLKPLNILVYGESTLKVADFGLGKFISRDTESLTMTTMGIGSECYAAPEQYQEGEAKNVDERADIYSLGKILYQLITYDLPVVIDEEKIKNSKFKLLVMKATKYDKNKRFNSVSEMKKMFNLLRGDKKKLKSTNQAFKEIYTEYINELDAGKIYELVEILLENEKNYALYTTEFMTIDINTLKIMILCQEIRHYKRRFSS